MLPRPFLPALQRHPWFRRAAWALAGLLAFWALAWLAVPPLLRSQGEKMASEALGRKVSIGRVEFSPWSLELTVHDLAVATADGSAAQLAIQRIYLDAELESLLRLAPVVDAIAVDQPALRLTHLGGGHYDVDDILARLTPPADAPPGKPLRFALYNLSVHGGRLDFADQSVNRTHELRDLSLGIPFLSNLDSKRTVKTVPHLAFALNGSRFDSTAQSTPFAQTRKTDATLSLRQFDLRPYLGYLPASLPVRLQGAVLSADLRLAFEQTPQPQVRLSGSVAAEKIQVATRSGGDLLAVERVDLTLNDLQPLARTADIARLALTAPQLTASRSAHGELNLLADLAAAPVATTTVARNGQPARATAPKASEPAASTPTSTTRPSTSTSAAPTAWRVQLAELQVLRGGAQWTDDAVAPQARLALSRLELAARQIQWPFEQPATFQGTALLEQTTLSFAGLGTDRAATATLNVNALPLPLAAPYLAQALTPRLAGRLDADLAVHWAADGPLRLSAPRLELHQLALTEGKTTLASVRNVKLTGVAADLTARTVQAEALAVTQPRATVERDANGRWMFERWLKATASSGNPSPAPSTEGTTQPWAASLGSLSVVGGPIAWVDRLPARPVAVEVSALQLKAGRLVLNGPQPTPVSLQLHLASGQTEAGTLALKGEVTAAPLSAQLAVDASRLPVHAFEPYFADALNVELLRADASFKGQVRYAAGAAGPSVRVSGDASVQDLRANSVAGTAAAANNAVGEELLTCQSLSLRGLDLALAPGTAPRVSLRETVLSDFYARVVLRESGRLNLLDVVKSAPAGSATTTTTPAATPAGLAPVITLGPLSVVNGRVQFSDRFIKPNYSAALSELTGRLGGFSSVAASGTPQLADLELRGKAEGTASLEIIGQLNPLAQPLVLDIKGTVRNLELSPLSPYSVKYAGHGIQRGKLSVDVRYQVQPDGHLQATNKLVLHQLAFGDEVKGAPNSLPVKLAVALLADRNGVIDIDMPISGSLNDPQFSLAPVIFKAIVNLILKAITAPFSLLANALGGGGDELSQVAFAPGSAALTAAAQQSLDKVAKALLDRPALNLTVVGTSRLDAERDAFKRARLQQLLMAEKRRASVVAGASATATVTVTPEEAPALLKAVYRRADITKPRNALGFAKDLPPPEMEALLLASLTVTEEQMRELALARGVAVRDYLAGKNLPPERLFLGAIQTGAEAGKPSATPSPNAPAWTPRAELNLASR
ncbi:MAG: DUF748 domain-containing protein [Ramlibacter sp.]|nr:DUF748 domain-containing protein [Ramlibacter sp.]